MQVVSSVQYFLCREAVKLTKEIIIIMIKYAILFIIPLEIMSHF